MTKEDLRGQLRGQIPALRKKRDASDSSEEDKQAAKDAIKAIQDAVREINIAIADDLGAKVDVLIEDLDAVLEKHQLDAVSALRRTIKGIRKNLP